MDGYDMRVMRRRPTLFFSVTMIAVAMSSGRAVGTAPRDCMSNVIERIGGSFHSIEPDMSADGRFVAFASASPELDTDTSLDIFVFDRQVCTIELISKATDGSKALQSEWPSISDDGRFVLFTTASQLSTDDLNSGSDLYVRDRTSGVTTLVSRGMDGKASGGSEGMLSGDGRWVAFARAAANLVPGDTNGASDIFVVDLSTGSIERVSISSSGSEGVGGHANSPVISTDGRFVAFFSTMTNLGATPNSETPRPVFLRDRAQGTTSYVDFSSPNMTTWVDGRGLAISDSGRYVVTGGGEVSADPADYGDPPPSPCVGVLIRDRQDQSTICGGEPPYSSFASNPLAMTPDGRYAVVAGAQVLIIDVLTGVATGVSSNVAGEPAERANQIGPVAISADGRSVAFASFSALLVPEDTNNSADIFVSEWQKIPARPNTGLMTNGSFMFHLDGWKSYATPTRDHLATSIVTIRPDANFSLNRHLLFSRHPPESGEPNQGVVFQETLARIPAQAQLEALFTLGNPGLQRKRISVLLHDADFSDLAVCTFWLEGATAPRTYGMRAAANEFWSNATISFYTATAGTEKYLLDGAALRYTPGLSSNVTECIDPAAPFAPGGANGPALVVNGDFSASLPPWTLWGNIWWQIVDGRFLFSRAAGAGPAGAVLQSANAPINRNDILTAQFSLGNSSPVRKRVSILLHDRDFSDLTACTFWLGPGQPVAPFSMRTFAAASWTNATVSFYPATSDQQQWLVLDDVSMRRTPGTATVGTECIGPTVEASAALSRRR